MKKPFTWHPKKFEDRCTEWTIELAESDPLIEFVSNTNPTWEEYTLLGSPEVVTPIFKKIKSLIIP